MLVRTRAAFAGRPRDRGGHGGDRRCHRNGRAVRLVHGRPGANTRPPASRDRTCCHPSSRRSSGRRARTRSRIPATGSRPTATTTAHRSCPSSAALRVRSRCREPHSPQARRRGQSEARKTEPDKNTYLVLKGQKGADPNYDYGTHFLFQGHEGGPRATSRASTSTRTAPHRVTLLATTRHGRERPTDDRRLTWDPWAQRLLFSEAGRTRRAQGGVWQGTLCVPRTVADLQRFLGRGGFEGIQNDDRGNLYIVEDVGGSNIAGRSKPCPTASSTASSRRTRPT